MDEDYYTILENIIKYSYLKNINIYFIKIQEELNQHILETISLFLVKPTYFEEIEYSVILKKNENIQSKNIQISKEYFIQPSNLNDLIYLFHIENIHKINHK